MFFEQNYHIERAPDGQVGWFVKDREGNTIAWYTDEDKAVDAIEGLSHRDLSGPRNESNRAQVIQEPSRFIG